MQRFVNDPSRVVDDMLKGFLKAHRNLVEPTANPRVVKSVFAPKKGRVGIVTGGGSGHKPAFVGYVGKNMVDAVAIGEIFSSPTAKSFHDAFKAADGGAGVACLYGNYAGDNMNVKMAKELAGDDGIRVSTVVANDDVPSAPKDQPGKRRGVAGEILMWKAGGARAAGGGDLEAVIAASQKAIDNTRSIGVGLTPCTIPEVGKPNFQIVPGKMELGIGHHGEPGIEVSDLKPADEVARLMVEAILPDLPFNAGNEVVTLVSGLGATPVMELYILYNKIEELIRGKGIAIHRAYVGNYFTSLEMMGATLSVMKLDQELRELVDYECDCMGLTQF
ncbi:MAG: dihydroxyacetone kinase subunit DhaK [Planctomycetota bacterium]|jgi:dihydroxyacetone kinase-like protein|nr:dihydroxyacetone kinase subunit DhaK [Planctomycetota bacterium]